MITAPSPIATIAPGLPGKGASPGGGEAFALSMLSVGTGVAADAPAASPIASRQAIAVPGIVLPTTDAAVAPDPAQSWLPSVTIAVPAPIDVPPALASAAPMVAAGRPVAPALRGSTSIGALAVTLPSAVVTGQSPTTRVDSGGDPKQATRLPVNIATIDIAEDGAAPLDPVSGSVRSVPFAKAQDSTGETATPAVKPKILPPPKRDHKGNTIAAAPERGAAPSPAAVAPTLETDTGGETRKAEPMPVSQPDMSGVLPPIVTTPMAPAAPPPVDAPAVEAPRGKQRVAIDGAVPLSPTLSSAVAPLGPQASQPRVSATGERPAAGRMDPLTLQPSTAPVPLPVSVEANDLAPAPSTEGPRAAASRAAPSQARDRSAISGPYTGAVRDKPMFVGEDQSTVRPATSPIATVPGAVSTPINDPATNDTRVMDAPLAQRGTVHHQTTTPAGMSDPAVAAMPGVSTPSTVPLRSGSYGSDASALAQRPAAPSFQDTRSGTGEVQAVLPSVSTPTTAPLRSESYGSDASALAQHPAASSFQDTRSGTGEVHVIAPSYEAQVASAAPLVAELPVQPAQVPTAPVPTPRAATAPFPSALPTITGVQAVAPSVDPQSAMTAPLNAAEPDLAVAPRAATPMLRDVAQAPSDPQAVRSLPGLDTAVIDLQRLSSSVGDAAAPARLAASPSPESAAPIVIDAPADARARASRADKAAPGRVEPATPDAATVVATPIERRQPAAFTAPTSEPLAMPVPGQQPVAVRADTVVSQPLGRVVADNGPDVTTPFVDRSYRASAAPRVPTPVMDADVASVAAPPAPSAPVVDGPVVTSPVQPFEVASSPTLHADRQTQPAEAVRVAARGVPEPTIVRGDAASPVIAASAPVGVAGAPIVTPPATPAPVATLVVPRQSFVREVTGGTRQSVALAPQAAIPPQPAAGVTAPAARVFGAAIHAASGNDERPRTEPVETAAAAIVPMTPAVTGAPVAEVGQPPLDMRQNDWPAVMIDRIEVLRDAANANDTRIRLVPDALGAITVAVKTVGDAIHVRFATEDTATRALIEEAQPKLVAIAEERGLKIGQTLVEVTAAAQQNAAQQNAGQQNSGQQNSGQQQAQGQAGQSPASSNANANGQQNAAQSQAQAQAQSQAQAQTGQQPRQQHTPSARQPASPARTSSTDTDAAGNGRIA